MYILISGVPCLNDGYLKVEKPSCPEGSAALDAIEKKAGIGRGASRAISLPLAWEHLQQYDLGGVHLPGDWDTFNKAM